MMQDHLGHRDPKHTGTTLASPGIGWKGHGVGEAEDAQPPQLGTDQMRRSPRCRRNPGVFACTRARGTMAPQLASDRDIRTSPKACKNQVCFRTAA